ncbi:MAG: hypothetical protein IT463_05670 [Planctomycetes bacterium]|nr:hypothetical protein [Planctomycetota bacterium]
MRGLILVAAVSCTLLAASCRSLGHDGARPEPVPTTLRRFDGGRVSLDDLRLGRERALAVATALELVEREIRDPSAEDRDARVLLGQLRRLHPEVFSQAEPAWEAAEPAIRAQGRGLFGECGCYADPRQALLPGAAADPPTLLQAVQDMLPAPAEAEPERLLAGCWRRFSPRLGTRGAQYLASAWAFELDWPTPVTLLLRDSLVGPFVRSVAQAPGASIISPPEERDGFAAPLLAHELVAPGPIGPLAALPDALGRRALPPGITLSPGAIQHPDADDRNFLAAAFAGLRAGCVLPESIPAATTRLTVCWSYLLDRSEARATVVLVRRGTGFELQTLDYQPAAASKLGQDGATLDLMPLLRGWLGNQG